MEKKKNKQKKYSVDCKCMLPALSLSICLSQASLCQFYNHLLPDLAFKINIFCIRHMFEISIKSSQELEINKQKTLF